MSSMATAADLESSTESGYSLGRFDLSDGNGSHFLVRFSVDSVKTSFHITPL